MMKNILVQQKRLKHVTAGANCKTNPKRHIVTYHRGRDNLIPLVSPYVSECGLRKFYVSN